MPLSEKKLIRQIRRSAGTSNAIVAGIGDDCAVLRIPPGHELLVTTDFSIENVHFRRNWQSPYLVGRRCLTRGLSDIASMGGDPLAAFLSMAVPRDIPQKWVNQFLRGLLALAREFKTPLAGGDTAQSDHGIQADIVVVGSVPKAKAVLRSGAKVGDHIYVTGQIGGARTALARLIDGKKIGGKKLGAEWSPYLRPTPRVAVGQQLRRRRLASSMIDLSDGLSTDLAHICEESGVGAEIESQAIPRAVAGREQVSLEAALNGGDDYELLFTSASRAPQQIAGVPVTCIGRIVRQIGMRLVGTDGKTRPLKPGGWQHFSDL